MVDKHFLELFNAVASRSEQVAKALPEGTDLLVTLVVDTDESLAAACTRLGINLDIPHTRPEIINVNNLKSDFASTLRGATRLLVVVENRIYDKFKGPVEYEFGYSLSLSLKSSANVQGYDSAADIFFLA
jgi:hypothetical protein